MTVSPRCRWSAGEGEDESSAVTARRDGVCGFVVVGVCGGRVSGGGGGSVGGSARIPRPFGRRPRALRRGGWQRRARAVEGRAPASGLGLGWAGGRAPTEEPPPRGEAAGPVKIYRGDGCSSGCSSCAAVVGSGLTSYGRSRLSSSRSVCSRVEGALSAEACRKVQMGRRGRGADRGAGTSSSESAERRSRFRSTCFSILTSTLRRASSRAASAMRSSERSPSFSSRAILSCASTDSPADCAVRRASSSLSLSFSCSTFIAAILRCSAAGWAAVVSAIRPYWWSDFRMF
eukprot:scaffold28315_cov48-Phaeocystis_antarctica.AAC.1